MNISIVLIFLSLICMCCQSERIPVNDLPPPVYEEPQTAPLRLQEKYVVNPFTGDSIKPSPGFNDIANHPTGIEIPAKGEIIHPDSMGRPVTVAAGKPFIIEADTNIHFINKQLKTIPVNELKLRKVKAGEGEKVVVNGIVAPLVQPIPISLPIPKIKENAKYQIVQFDESTGLSSPIVNWVFEDKDGNIWFGMAMDGAIKYDGNHLYLYKSREGFQKSNGKNPLHNVWNIVGDSKGNIWFGGASGITKYDGKNFINFPRNQSSMSKALLPAFEDSTGTMWFLNLTGITKYDGKIFTSYTIIDGKQGNFLQGICIDKKGNIWTSSKNGLCRFDGEEFTYFSKADGLPGDYIYGANCDNEGIIWITTNDGITKYDGKTFTHITSRDGLFVEGLLHTLQDKKGNHWFTSLNGIAKYDGTSFTSITKNEGLAGNKVFTLAEDREGGIWVPTQQGISRIDGGGSTFYNENRLPDLANMNSLMEDTSGSIWIGCLEKGLIRYDGAKFNHYTKAQGLPNDTIMGLRVDGDNRVYVITPSGMCFLDGGNICYFENGIFSNIINCTLSDNLGNRWFGFGAFPATPGLIQFDGNHYIRFGKEGGLLRNVISSLFNDSKGNIWIGYIGAGVTKYDGKNFIHYTEKEGLPDNNVTKIAEDNAGNIWFANKGLTKFDGKNFTWFSEKQGVDYVSLFKNYNNSGFLFGTRKGVSVIEFMDAATVSNENKLIQPPLSFHTYPIPDYQVNPMLTPFLLLTSKNELWKADGRNLVKQDLAFFSTSLQPPEVRLKSIGINGSFIDFNHISDSLKKVIRFSETGRFYNYPVNPEISFSGNFISFNYVAIEWKEMGKVKYSYKMEGLEENWSTPTAESKVDYRSLPSGEYVFKVCAMGVSRQWGKPFSYAFTILPPWYATWWAYLLYIAGFFTSLVLFSKLRSQKLERETRVLEEKIARRTAALSQKSDELQGSLVKLHEAQTQLIKEESDKVILKERMRVSAELHDEIGATLSGIAMYSHLVKSKLDDNEADAAKHSVNIIQDSAAEMVIKLNDIIWLTNPQQDSLEDVMFRLKEYTQSMCLAKNITPDFQIDVAVAACKPAIEIRKNIYLFCKEAINNAVKYSNAASLLLKCTIQDGLLEITIRDDGDGFNIDSVKRGNGLDNMQKRADDMGAVFGIQSQPQQGCLIILTLKITQSGIA